MSVMGTDMKSAAKRIAITGGRGRVAPGLAAFLCAAGYTVTLFSRKADSGLHDTASLAGTDGLKNFDVVLHLGWSTVPLVAEENPGIEEREDLPLARSLVAAAGESAHRPQLVFFSTAAVYGNTGSEAATEEMPCRPLGRYAASKLQAEQIFLRYDNACVLRITNVFSAAGAVTRPQGIIPVLLQAARSGSEVRIWGDGSAVKDYLAVPDLHRAAESVIAAGLHGVFNVSSGYSLSVNELVALVEESGGRPIRRTHAPRYPWDVTTAHVASAKLQRCADWKPEISPRDFVRASLRQGAPSFRSE